MRWPRQALHVARKDVRHTRWLIAAYALAILGVIAASVFWLPISAAATQLGGFMVIILGLILIAVTVQSDSPVTADAYWLSRPLSPPAVMAAKLLFGAGLVLGPALLGQAAALAGHAVPPSEFPGLLLVSAAAYGSWVVTAAALAALTTDLRSFIVAGVLLLLVGLFATPLFLTSTTGVPGEAPAALPAVLIAGGWLGILVHQYLTRNVRRGRWLAVALVALSTVLPLAAHRSAAHSGPAVGDVPEILKPGTLEVAEISLGSGRELMLGLEAARLQPTHRYVLAFPVAHLLRMDADPVPLDMRHPVELGGGERPRISSNGAIRWLNGEDVRLVSRRGIQLDLSPEQRRLFVREGARLRLEGSLTVLEPQTWASLPLRSGSTVVSEGRRMRIEAVRHGPEGPSIDLTTSTIELDEAPPLERRSWLGGEGRPLYALIHRARNEGFFVTRGSSSGTSGGFIIPGPRTWISSMELRPPPFTRSETVPDAEWLRRAELVVGEWVTIGSYPVRIEASTDRE